MRYRYDFTRLLVRDFKACFKFYRDIMDFEVGFGGEEGGYADFKLGEVNLALFDQSEMSQVLGTTDLDPRAASQDSVCLIFGVDDVDGAWTELKQAGVDLIVEPTDHPDWGIRTAHFRDPDGNLIEINQPL